MITKYMFDKLLIANRGEIACRVIKTAQALGIHCIAVYSEADKQALHVKLADEAHFIGAAPSQQSYLRIDKLIEVAKKSNADAIHPGYGFLSENTEFAKACQQAKITFIGPTPEVIESMGSKIVAKEIMQKAKVPVVPSYQADGKNAGEIDYPVLLKAASGGGGKGMRIVENKKDFAAALAAAKREALSSFADDTMLVEKYLAEPRHIEIQIFADNHGNCIYLFERDCSIQRRYQKIIEESPAPGLSDELRQQMGNAACLVAKAVNYSGAGTVEFLLDTDNQFYFMEMNTRLQVEHPVTEMVTRQDLVEWQLRIAAGETLPLTQQQVSLHGHAIEVRIYAENPANDFLPSTGKIHYLDLPKQTEHVRIDHGIQQGDVISPHYDPMLAKLIVWDEDRNKAIQRLQQALWQFHLAGVNNNIAFLSRLVKQNSFKQAEITTNFINKHHQALFAFEQKELNQSLLLASLSILLQQQCSNSATYAKNGQADSPWAVSTGWRANLSHQQQLKFLVEQNELIVTIAYQPDYFQIQINDTIYQVTGKLLDQHQLEASIDGHMLQASVVQYGNELLIMGHDLHYCLNRQELDPIQSADINQHANLTSPMPGTIIEIMTKKKQKVKSGSPLLILEAMKMEHTVYAPSDGTVDDIFYQKGDLVEEGVELFAFSSSE